MTYTEAVQWLVGALPVWERSGGAAYKPGLERIDAFARTLGCPQDRFPSIHIAGTNGKGSTAHLLAAVLQSAGLRVGLFTSPHLVDFRERIRIDGEPIPEAAVVSFTERWADEMVARGLSFFEMATAMGLWWFGGDDAGPRVDIAVIEAGLGGRLDSTNIITPTLSIITNIGLEHTAYLGPTLASIASEKAGIIKPGVPVVVGESIPETADVFRTRAAEVGSPIVFAERVAGDFVLDLGGDYQHKNVATVLAAVEVLREQGIPIFPEALRHGLAHAASLTGLRGRWEVLAGGPNDPHAGPLVVCDTAHNAHGLEQVTAQIARTMAARREADPTARLIMVLGFAADKDLDAIVPLLPPDAHYILTAADTPRAMPVAELAKHLPAAEVCPKVPAAVARALAIARPVDFIYIGGSNFVVGELLKSLQ